MSYDPHANLTHVGSPDAGLHWRWTTTGSRGYPGPSCAVGDMPTVPPGPGPDPGPSLTDLVGIDPDMTADRTPEEHLARLRVGDEPFDELAQRDAEIERLRGELDRWHMLEQAVVDAAKAWADVWRDGNPARLGGARRALLTAVAELRAAEDGGGRDDG